MNEDIIIISSKNFWDDFVGSLTKTHELVAVANFDFIKNKTVVSKSIYSGGNMYHFVDSRDFNSELLLEK